MKNEHDLLTRSKLLQLYPGALPLLEEHDKHVHAGNLPSIAIKVGGGIIEDPELLEDCVQAIQKLMNLGLSPVIVHGGGPQISQALKQAHDESEFRDGLRVTSLRALQLVVGALGSVNRALIETCKQRGIAAVGLSDCFIARHIDQAKYGEVGRVTQVELAGIQQAVKHHELPIISCIARVDDNSYLNANGDDAAAALVEAIRPIDYISFTPTGGVFGTDGSLLRHIDPAVAHHLHTRGQLEGGMHKKVVEALGLIDSGIVSKIIIVHPRHLLEELFGDDGQGTIISASS